MADVAMRDGEAIQALRKWARSKRGRSFEIEYDPATGPYVWCVRTRDNECKGKDYGTNLRVAIRRSLEDLEREREDTQPTTKVKLSLASGD